MRMAVAVALALGLVALPAVAEKKPPKERLRELSRKLARRLAMDAPEPDHRFLHEQASLLLERTKQARGNDYHFDRLARATDALLEASERLFDARTARDNESQDKERERASRELQRDYFRVRQAEYFAGLRKADSSAYLDLSRRLYHRARAAYDERQYTRARKLGDAASLVARGLDYLAQDEVPDIDPPRWKEPKE